MSDDGVAYIYQNVAVAMPGDDSGVAYTYQNIGWFGTTSAIGKVVGLAARPKIGAEYIYQNVEV